MNNKCEKCGKVKHQPLEEMVELIAKDKDLSEGKPFKVVPEEIGVTKLWQEGEIHGYSLRFAIVVECEKIR